MKKIARIALPLFVALMLVCSAAVGTANAHRVLASQDDCHSHDPNGDANSGQDCPGGDADGGDGDGNNGGGNDDDRCDDNNSKRPCETEKPTDELTDTPAPTDVPTDVPTATDTPAPTDVPTDVPTATDTPAPTDVPTDGCTGDCWMNESSPAPIAIVALAATPAPACNTCCNTHVTIDIMDVQGFDYGVEYTFTINQEPWRVIVYDMAASDLNLTEEELNGCFCGPDIAVHPEVGQTLTVVIIEANGDKHVSEVSMIQAVDN